MLNSLKKLEPADLSDKNKYRIGDYILNSLKKNMQPAANKAFIYDEIEFVMNELTVKDYVTVHPEFGYHKVLTEKGYKFAQSGFCYEFFDKRNGQGDMVDYILYYIEKNGFFPLTKSNTPEENKGVNYAIAFGYITSDAKLTEKGMQISLLGISHLEYELKHKQEGPPVFNFVMNINQNYGTQGEVSISSDKD